MVHYKKSTVLIFSDGEIVGLNQFSSDVKKILQKKRRVAALLSYKSERNYWHFKA